MLLRNRVLAGGVRAARYRRTSEKKREDMGRGRQFSRQPKDVARKTAPYRQQQQSRTDGAGASPRELKHAAASTRFYLT